MHFVNISAALFPFQIKSLLHHQFLLLCGLGEQIEFLLVNIYRTLWYYTLLHMSCCGLLFECLARTNASLQYSITPDDQLYIMVKNTKGFILALRTRSLIMSIQIYLKVLLPT